MGCDIHWYVEVRNRETGEWAFAGKEKWVYQGDDWSTSGYDWEGIAEADWEERCKLVPDFIYDGRCYVLFSILAGVRNYGGVTPIAEPRGVPENASPEYRREIESWGVDAHTPSWLTLRELGSYDWNRAIPRSGIITLDDARSLKNEGAAPQWHCQGIGGHDIFVADTYEDAEGIAEKNPDVRVYMRAEWYESSREWVGFFLEKTIPAMAELGEPDDVRAVFFFDN
jgi:hypothetical protein